MGTPHKHAKIIKAWADGAEIQVRYRQEEWRECQRPALVDGDYEYRIKPEPKPDVVAFYFASPFVTRSCWEHEEPNMRMVFDGETRALKAVEVLK